MSITQRESPARRRAKRPGINRAWRHPERPGVVLPYKVMATIALIEMGVRDYALIAAAVGLPVKDVKQIDTAEDRHVRQMAVQGIPSGEFFKLTDHIRCPKCSGWIKIAPCVACAHQTRA